MVTSFPEKYSSTKWLNGPVCRRMLPHRLPKAWPLQKPSLLTQMSITCRMVICANTGTGCFSHGYLVGLFSFLVHSWWLIWQLSDYLTTELPKLPDLSQRVLRLFPESWLSSVWQPAAFSLGSVGGSAPIRASHVLSPCCWAGIYFLEHSSIFSSWTRCLSIMHINGGVS